MPGTCVCVCWLQSRIWRNLHRHSFNCQFLPAFKPSLMLHWQKEMIRNKTKQWKMKFCLRAWFMPDCHSKIQFNNDNDFLNLNQSFIAVLSHYTTIRKCLILHVLLQSIYKIQVSTFIGLNIRELSLLDRCSRRFIE